MTDQRAKFEAWWKENYDGSDAERAFAYIGWCASRSAALEEAAQVCEHLRDDHCAGTRAGENDDSGDWCYAQGDDCEFVAAWNDAAAAIRARAAAEFKRELTP